MSSLLHGFAEPVEGGSEAIADAVASAFGAAVVTRLLEGHGRLLAEQSEPVAHILRSWCEAPASSATVWDPVFGRAFALTKQARPDECRVRELAALLALRIAETTTPEVPWDADFRPMPVVLGDRLVLGVTAVEVRTGGQGTVVLRDRDGTVVELSRDGASSWEADSPQAVRVPTLDRAGRLRILPGTALLDDAESRAALAQCQALDEIDRSTTSVFADGWELLAAVAPEYLDWVAGGIRGVVASSIEAPFHLVSGSWEDLPGFIHASTPHVPLDIAEILVHEAAHQYFYLLGHLGPVDDGSDPELYWSPPIRMKRPLHRVLMAYHALVNVLHLYEAVQAAGAPEAGYAAANEAQLRADIAVLEAPLRDNPALTAVGRGLFEPLADRVRALTPA